MTNDEVYAHRRARNYAGRPLAVEMMPVASSHLEEIGFRGENLWARFKGEPVGPLYVYDDVPRSVYAALLEADRNPGMSVGSLFNLLVKRQGYGYRRVE